MARWQVGRDKSPGRVANQLGVYGLATGQLAAVLHTWTGSTSCVLAPNPVHGDVLVVIETMLPHKQCSQSTSAPAE